MRAEDGPIGRGLVPSDRTPIAETLILAAVSAIPGIGGPLAILVGAAIDADRGRMGDVVNATREVVDDDKRLMQRLEQDERLRDMLLEALAAGASSALAAKRIAMGRVLGQAVNDDAQLDDSAAMLHALATLDSPHFALMAKIENLVPNPLGGGFPMPEPYKSALIAQGVVYPSSDALALKQAFSAYVLSGSGLKTISESLVDG